MSQGDVAIMSRITQQHYSLIENGERVPSVDTAQAIAAVLGFNWTLFYEQDSIINK